MSDDEMGVFARTIYRGKYAQDGEEWSDTATRVCTAVFSAVAGVVDDQLVVDAIRALERREWIPGGRYLYAAGRPFHQTNNCFLLIAEDSREGWADLIYRATMSLMTGGGIGAYYGDLRPSGAPIRRTGGKSSGPMALMEMVNEVGRHVKQGGSRRSAIWAGLPWFHDNIGAFIRMKNWSPEVRALKERDFNFPAPMDMTNISVCLDDSFFDSYHDEQDPDYERARRTYGDAVRLMLKTGEPGFSVDTLENGMEVARNACTEITSGHDSDVCNLAHINLARVRDAEHLRRLCEIVTAFCLAGTLYSHVPYPKVAEVRNINRRLGVGILGVHEWLMQRGRLYGPDPELEQLLEVYQTSTRETADRLSAAWGISTPKKVRAIAPTGTTGIVAETTTGIEPMFCAAYKRRYLEGSSWRYQFVVDPTARRMVEKFGRKADELEDAITLSEDPERRIAFQAWVQQFVDHGISSTINLPAFGTPNNNDPEAFGKMLMKYLPKLRGITAYPDGSRGGQPLTRIRFEDAIASEGEVFEESVDVCDLKGGGSCGD